MCRVLNFLSYSIFASLLVINSINAEEIRDYYSEPGLHPFKDPTSDLNETIDPFSGTMQLRHSDITVPGNGGMDITVTRFYTNHQDFGNRQPGYQSIYGNNWTMHFGRIVVPQAHSAKICTQQQWAVTTADNPSIEHPDGGRELLFLTTDGSGDLITKSNWRARCISGQDGMELTSPAGTVYTMDVRSTVSLGANSTETSWYTSRIVDVHGNAIEITYLNHPRGYLYFDEVAGGRLDNIGEFLSDGRLVKFNYEEDPVNSCFRLDNITSDNRIWRYSYSSSLADPDPDFKLCRYNLTEVTLPSNQKWEYEYYSDTHSGAGKFSLSKVTYPYGGVYEYTYQHVQFDPEEVNQTTAIRTKSISGPDITSGTWTYTFSPGSLSVSDGTNSVLADVTQINQPNGIMIYVHQGANAIGLNNVWTAGLLLRSQVLSLTGEVIEQTVPNWNRRLISNENYFHGVQGEVDTESYAPIQTASSTWRNGNTHTKFMTNHDEYGNPQTIEETTIIIDEPNKVTNISYYNNLDKWIIGVTEDETITDIGTIDRTINELGQVVSENKYGVITNYTYTPEGDVNTITDARNNTVTKSDYFRGIPRLETHPESVTITRTVNPTGTVASLTNGRGHTKNFTYDGLNRLTGIDFPLNADVSVDWTFTGKVLTRENYQEEVIFDGFGKEAQVNRVDTNSSETITKNTTYDALGQKVFESYPNSAAGITFSYDVLGRLTRLEHPDGAFRTYDFGTGGIVVTETDERSNQTEFLYRAYGHPDNGKVPLNILSPENICTFMDYNLLNQMTRVFQGELNPDDGQCSGSQRTYTYDSKYFLESESNSETGITTYGRDEIGNMTSRQVGASGITSFTYDNRNRLTFTDYPGSTPDVTRIYDENDNIREVNNADSEHEYIYDENDNLISEVINIGSDQYSVEYTYDSNDIIKTLTYPTGRLIDYAPDAFGRPTQITPYVNNVDYYPSGQIQQITYANGQTTDITLNDRLWIGRIHAHGITEASDLTYQYDDIGNIESITDAIDPLNSKSLVYDNMNRLVSADGSWGASSFSYDGRGNLLTMNISGLSMNYDYSSQRLSRVIHGSSGTQSLYSYDVYGNVEYDTTANLTLTQVFSESRYIYDDAGNLRTAFKSQGGGPTHDYGYDGNGMRVSKTTSVPTEEDIKYVYAKNGNLLGEYKPVYGTAFGKENIYLGSQLVASPQENLPPIANAGNDTTVLSGREVSLNGSGSRDPDGNIVAYSWQQTAGTTVTLTNSGSVNPTFISPTITGSETLTFELTVTDNDGVISNNVDSVNINIEPNTAPTVTISSPTNGSLYEVGESTTFVATANDIEDGNVSSSLTWTSNIDGALGAGPTITVTLTQGSHVITAVATDSGLLEGSASISVSVSVTNNPVWNFSTGGPVDSSSTIGPDGTMYVGSNDDKLYALNPDGTEKWSFSSTGDISSAPVIGAGGRIYFTSEDGQLYALDADGNELWSFTGSYVMSSPAIGSDGILYIYDDSRLRAINPDGSEKWSRQINYTINSNLHSSPVIASDGSIYIGSDSTVTSGGSSTSGLYKLNPTNGSIAWIFPVIGDISSSPAIAADGTIYIATLSNWVYAVNPDGSEKWRYRAGHRFIASPVIGEDGTIYIGSWDRNLYAFNPVDGSINWQYTASNIISSTAAVAADGTIYFGSHGNTFHALNSDGSLKWFVDIGIGQSSASIAGDGTVLIGDSDGNFHAFADDNGGPANSSWPMHRHDIQRSGNVLLGDVDIAPVVSITSPTDGSVINVGDSITLIGEAIDTEDGDISNSIEWSSSIDGVLGTGSSIGPISLSEGNHVISASASDSASNTQSDSINITVSQPVNNAPVVVINSPTDGSTFNEGEVVNLSAIANDVEDGDISASIQWTSDNQGVLGSGADLNVVLDLGNHALSATITDAGGLTNSAMVLVTVEATVNTLPDINISSPLDGSSHVENETILFLASAIDVEDGDISNDIEWSSNVDGILGNGANISSVLSVGPHNITASVTDSNNAVSTHTVNLIIEPLPNTPPTVNIISPVDGATFDVSETITFSGIAGDDEDGDLSNAIVWQSDLDGQLGVGTTLNTMLSLGTHTISALVTDSDGATTSSVVAITVTALSNTLPEVNITSPNDGAVFQEGETVLFSATASDAEDGDISEDIQWSSDIDGILGTGALLSTTLSIGNHEITVIVIDSSGADAIDMLDINITGVVNTAPTINITQPLDGSAFTEGTSIVFDAEAIDLEDGNISSNIQWSSDQDGVLGTGAMVSATLSVGVHSITANVSDSEGEQALQSIVVTVSPIGNTPPILTITSPANGDEYIVGELVNLIATAIDSEDGNLGTTIEWQSDIDGSLGVGDNLSVNLNVGLHTISAAVSDSEGVTVTETVSIRINIDGEVATDVELTTNVPSPQAEGTIVTLSAEASGGSGNYEYQFRFKGRATHYRWQVLQDFSTDNTVEWDTSRDRGRNYLEVRARNAGSDDEPVRDIIKFKVTQGSPITDVELTSSEDSPVDKGTKVTLTAEASGGSGDYLYQFWVKGPSTHYQWKVLQHFSSDNTVEWNTKYYPGHNKLKVLAKNKGSYGRWVRDEIKIYVTGHYYKPKKKYGHHHGYSNSWNDRNGWGSNHSWKGGYGWKR